MYYSDVLQHHGILGMKWGVRRYQNKDGSLTAEGKARQKSSTSSTSSATKTAAAAAGTVLAGPVVGITAGVISGGVTYAISSKKSKRSRFYVCR